MPVSPEECAHELMEVVPLAMRAIRATVRSHREHDLSVPQQRTLSYLRNHEGASLSHLAEHIGLGLPSMSKLVDGLVTRGLVARHEDRADRRRLALSLTPEGRIVLNLSRAAAEAELARTLAMLPEAERGTVAEAMGLLRGLFAAAC